MNSFFRAPKPDRLLRIVRGDGRERARNKLPQPRPFASLFESPKHTPKVHRKAVKKRFEAQNKNKNFCEPVNAGRRLMFQVVNCVFGASPRTGVLTPFVICKFVCGFHRITTHRIPPHRTIQNGTTIRRAYIHPAANFGSSFVFILSPFA